MEKFIGADIGGTAVKLGIIDETGAVLARREIEYSFREASPDVMKLLKEGIREFLHSEELSAGDLSGTGVSSAGCIDSVNGRVAGNGGNIPNWGNKQVCRELEDEFGIPAALANDANCAILGELWTGAARGYSDVVGITLGTGVGGGVVSGGRLLEGNRGYAGELGHFPYHVGGELCSCGMRGCYERYASTAALVRRGVSEDAALNSGRRIFEAAAKGSRAASGIIEDWINEVAGGIAGFIHIFDPQLILIGGGVSSQEDMLIKPLRTKVMELIMPDYREGLEFRAASLGNDAGMIGAVYYLMSSGRCRRG